MNYLIYINFPRKVTEYKPDYLMSHNEACQQILSLIDEYQKENKELYGLNSKTKCISIARIGTETQKMVYFFARTFNLTQPITRTRPLE